MKVAFYLQNVGNHVPEYIVSHLRICNIHCSENLDSHLLQFIHYSRSEADRLYHSFGFTFDT